MVFTETLVSQTSALRVVLMQPEEEDVLVQGMKVLPVPVGSVGAKVVVTCIDEAGNVLDVSGATSIVFYSRDEANTTQITDGAAGALYSDGTDGKVSFTLTTTEANTIRSLYCGFQMSLGGVTRRTRMFIVDIEPWAEVI